MDTARYALGLALVLGFAGCAGFGVQQGSSLADSYGSAQDLDGLWVAPEEAPAGGGETRLYAEQELGELWEAPYEEGAGVTRVGYQQRGSDLWNAPSETTGGEQPAPRLPRYLFGQSSGGPDF